MVCETEPVRPSEAVTRAVAAPAEGAPGTTGTGEGRGIGGRDPQRLRRRLEGDLDNIVMKAISKEPARRYASVDQLAEDVRRHLGGLPVLARPDTLGYRTSKFVRRHRGAVAAAAAVFLALVAGIVGTSWQARVARAERAKAEQRFADTRALANAFLFDVHDAVKDLAGSTPARQLMVRTGIAYLDKLAADAGDPADLRRELVVGYSRLGDMLAATGATADALAQHRLALGIMQGLAATAPDDPDNLRQLGVAFHKVGNVLGNPNYPNIGDHAGALAEMRQSIAVFERAAARYPDTAMFRRNLAVARSNAADILTALGQRDEAMREERLALETYEAQVRQDPSNAAAKNDLAFAYYKAAEMLDAEGRTREALASLDRAATLQDQLAAADPQSTRARGETATNHGMRGRLLAKLGQRVGALSSLQHAVAISRELSAGNPDNVEMRVTIALALIERADAALVLSRLPGHQPADREMAVRDYTETVTILQTLKDAGAIEGTDVEHSTRRRAS